MRPLALVGLLLSLLLAVVAVFDVGESRARHRDEQDRALQGAVENVAGHLRSSNRQMVTAAGQMLVNPTVRELLDGIRLGAARRRDDQAGAATALAAFEQQAILPVSASCIDDATAAQLACGPRARGIVYPASQRHVFAAVAAVTDTGQPSPTFISPVTGLPTGSFVVPMRLAGRLVGLFHVDATVTRLARSSVLAAAVPGVRVQLALEPLPAHAGGGPTRWSTVVGGHRKMIADLPLRIGDTPRTLAVAASAVAANPDVFNSWDPAELAVLGLALVMLVGSITALAAAGRRTRRELASDPLTRLRNRRALMEALPRVCERADEEEPAYLWFYDLNGFKAYNDAFGHLAGDAVLARLGRRLEETVSPFGHAYRLGGDEFCVVVDQPVSDPLALFEKARAALTEQGGAFTVTASAGAVEIPREAREPAEALRLADHHMYRDKAASRAGAAEVITAVLHAALAQRHPELDEHSSDVAGDVELLARAVGLDDETVELIIRAGDLHDVGKLGIPDEIIAKPGPLSEREWEFMRQHTVMGERIIAAAGPSLERIAPLVRASHERWDGRGYPDGLAGEEIPLGARIITICDSYRAMLSERPYKRAMPAPDALAELRRCAGTQFDPELVAVFCGLAAAGAAQQPTPGSHG
jgi:diguanylate cyclase (GGDEF)-like protein